MLPGDWKYPEIFYSLISLPYLLSPLTTSPIPTSLPFFTFSQPSYFFPLTLSSVSLLPPFSTVAHSLPAGQAFIWAMWTSLMTCEPVCVCRCVRWRCWHVHMCLCVCIWSADTCVCDRGADTSDRGVVLLLKSCWRPLTFEEASKVEGECVCVGGVRGEGRGLRIRGAKGQKEKKGLQSTRGKSHSPQLFILSQTLVIIFFFFTGMQ